MYKCLMRRLEHLRVLMCSKLLERFGNFGHILQLNTCNMHSQKYEEGEEEEFKDANALSS